MTPTRTIWRNGALIPWDAARIHVLSHVVSYGSSVFEGLRCYETPAGPALFRAREHMRRLVDSARIYRIELPWTAEQLTEAACELVREAWLQDPRQEGRYRRLAQGPGGMEAGLRRGTHEHV